MGAKELGKGGADRYSVLSVTLLESLRLGRRLQVEEEIDPALAGVLTLPFSFQPLVENAVQHGVQSSPKAGRLRLVVCRVGKWLEMSVSDDGLAAIEKSGVGGPDV